MVRHIIILPLALLHFNKEDSWSPGTKSTHIFWSNPLFPKCASTVVFVFLFCAVCCFNFMFIFFNNKVFTSNLIIEINWNQFYQKIKGKDTYLVIKFQFIKIRCTSQSSKTYNLHLFKKIHFFSIGNWNHEHDISALPISWRITLV